MNLSEAIKLLSRLPRNPLGFYDEIMVRLELRREHSKLPPPSYQPRDFEDVVSEIENCLQKNLREFLSEPALLEIENKLNKTSSKLVQSSFPLIHNGDPRLARLCYAICRATKPSVFIETGVAYGVTSSYILKAMAVNGQGKLYSIDRPPFARNAVNFIGAFIPKELKHDWHLYRGQSRKILPDLLNELGQVDIFLHDSRHTYNNMHSEFLTVAPYLTNRSFLIADDVNRNIAFQEWVAKSRPAFSATVAEKARKVFSE
jgi:predicted O-methyltransferase YrrM